MKKFLLLIVFGCGAYFVSAQQRSDTVCVYYRSGQFDVDLVQKSVDSAFKVLVGKFERMSMDTLCRNLKLNLRASSSLDGANVTNVRLNRMRAEKFIAYIRGQISLPDSMLIFHGNYSVYDWKSLEQLVDQSDIPYKDEVLFTLRDIPEWNFDKSGRSIEMRKRQLELLRGGVPYTYIRNNFFSKMRKVDVWLSYSMQMPPEPAPLPVPIPIRDTVVLRDTVVVRNTLVIRDTFMHKDTVTVQLLDSIQPEITTTRRQFCMVVRTNLLYDATTTFNLGVEFGLGRRTTLDVSCNYNPWTLGSGKKIKHWLIQPEFRYWLGERFRKHFFGLHLHGGEFNVTGLGGSIGDFRYFGSLYGVGVSYGYLWRLGKRWGLEATLGAGYSRFHYKKYDLPWCSPLIEERNKNYFGITKAGVSLIFVIDTKK